jgi:predicted Zn-dependent peptidase
VQSAGGELNAMTTFDYTGYYLKLPANQLKLALWIESERMLHARVEQIGVETQRSVVKEERKGRYENSPYGSWLEEMARDLFKGTPYEWVPIGSTQYIDLAQIDEFRDFYKHYYVPNNAVLTIVGDIDVPRAKQLVMDYFNEIPAGAKIDRPAITLPMGTTEVVREVREPQTPLPALFYGYRTPKMSEPDSYAMSLLTRVLANGNSSRLYRDMVDEHQLAVQVASFPFSLEGAGMTAILAIAHPSTTVEQLGAAFDKEVADVQATGVTDEEFQKARNQFETEFASRYTEALDKAMALAEYKTFYNDPNMINTEIDRYMAVTREDLQRVARKYLNPSNRVVLKYLPADKGGVH